MISKIILFYVSELPKFFTFLSNIKKGIKKHVNWRGMEYSLVEGDELHLSSTSMYIKQGQGKMTIKHY